MCGLVGIAGDVTHQARTRVFRDMLDVCQVRGRDSTGVIKVNRDLQYDWVKQVGPPSILCDSRMYERRVELGETAALIGHTRSKTVGDVTVKNAHPFDFPDEGICGVHNGTLRSYHGLDTYTFQKVDSEVLYGHLSLNGPKDTFSQVEGAYACVWWNDKDKSLNFIRNDQRPLWFTWSKDKKMMFWASEVWMFGAVARHIELWDGGESKKVYLELPPHQHWIFNINAAAKGDEPVITMKPIVEIKLEKKATAVGQASHGTNRQRGEQWKNNWEQLENGEWVRKDESDDPTFTMGKPGGEVPRPFDKAAGAEKEQTPLILLDKLDDELPEALRAPTQEKKTTSPLSSVSFLTHSLQRSGSTTRQTGTRHSNRNILSLPERNSPTSRSNSKGAKLSSIVPVCPGSNAVKNSILSGVSFRTVVGIDYITDNKTKTEWTMAAFMENTKGRCCFCKEPFGDNMDKIGEIVDATHVLCTSCLEDPGEDQLFNAAAL